MSTILTMDKSQIRKQYKSLREGLSKTQIENRSISIANRCLELPIWNKQIMHIFLSIENQKEVLIQKLYVSKNQRISFEELLAEKPEKILAIFNFLAVLELLQLKKIILHLGEGFNNFWMEPKMSSP